MVVEGASYHGAALVGPSRHVSGVDTDPQMVDKASASAREAGGCGMPITRQFRSTRVEAAPVVARDAALFRLAFQMDRVEAHALQAGIPQQDVDRWRTGSDRPHFFATGLYFLIAGRV